MEFQTLNGSVYHSFVVPFFIDSLDLRKISKSIALAGSRGSGKSTYIQYFSHATRFDKNKDNVNEEEFDCIILYWKPDIAYCQGLKEGWLGKEDAKRFFNLHAGLSLLKEFSRLIVNINYHFNDLVPELERNKTFWNNLSKATQSQLGSTNALDQWIMDYEYHISTRLNPLNSEGLLSIDPKYLLNYLTDSLRKDYKKFEKTSFKVFVDEFELLKADQQKIINTYRKESNQLLNWNVAYKLNSSPTKETTSDQWLQSPDDYSEENLDVYIAESYELFAAEIFILALQNAGLGCHSTELTPAFLGDRSNIPRRREPKYKTNVFRIVKNLMPTPSVNDLTEICFKTNSVQTKLKKDVLPETTLSEDVKKELLENPHFKSLAITILGTYRQRSFDEDILTKFVRNKASASEEKKINEKIQTFEYNTLLSLNLQHSSIQVPVYAGFERFITMTSPNIRHFKELCLSALKAAQTGDVDNNYDYIEDIAPISLDAMHSGAISISTSLVKEVINYPPHGNKLSNLVNRLGELFRISQKSAYQTEPERNIFTFPYDHAGSDLELENVIRSALSWRVLVEDNAKRIKDDLQITSKEYSLNPIYAPRFGISYRKKRGIKFSLKDFKTILNGSADDFEVIRKSYQQKWKLEGNDDQIQGRLV